MGRRERGVVLAALMFALVAAVVPPSWAANSVEGEPSGVRAFMEREGGPPSGLSTVDGVVSRVFPESSLIALIDVEEFRECKVVTCAKLTLPVQWQGDLPAVASIVRVTGAVEKQGMGKIFRATALEVRAPPPGGTQ